MALSLLHTFLELGHQVSENLEFSHRDDVHVSYGEESITESCLLEIRRNHPQKVMVRTFSKANEALNGADWEWHFVGKVWSYRMRVQAKRVDKRGYLRGIWKTIGKFQTRQIDVLISEAKRHNLAPFYCFYSSEGQRSFWVKSHLTKGKCFEYGCLLMPADKVLAVKGARFSNFERGSFPWHFLVSPFLYQKSEGIFERRFAFDNAEEAVVATYSISASESFRLSSIRVPTIAQLNSENFGAEGWPGIEKLGGISADDYIGILSAREYDFTARRTVIVDVREIEDGFFNVIRTKQGRN